MVESHFRFLGFDVSSSLESLSLEEDDEDDEESELSLLDDELSELEDDDEEEEELEDDELESLSESESDPEDSDPAAALFFNSSFLASSLQQKYSTNDRMTRYNQTNT